MGCVSIPDDGQVMWRIGQGAPPDAVFIDAETGDEIVSVDE